MGNCFGSYKLNMSVELGIYKHYKGNLYEVIAVATHSESLEKMVVYKALYQKEGENMWVRPLAMFQETVLIKGQKTPRFLRL